MGTHSGVFAWKIPWAEENGRLQSVGSQRVKQNWVTNTFTLVTKLCLNLCDPADCSLPSSMEFFRQEYRSGLPFSFFLLPSLLDLPNSRIESASPTLPVVSCIADWFFTAEPAVLAIYINIFPIYRYFSQVYFNNFRVISFPRWYGDYIRVCISSVQFTQSRLILCDPMDYSRPGLPVSPINNKGQFLFFTFMALLDITNQIALLIK